MVYYGSLEATHWEPLFSWAFHNIARTGLPFVEGLMLFKIFIFILICSQILANYKKSDLAVFSIFFSSVAIFLFVDNPLRQFAALPVFFWAYTLMAKDKKAWILVMLIGMTIHFSTVLLLLLYLAQFIRPFFFVACATVGFFLIYLYPEIILIILSGLEGNLFLTNIDWYFRWYLSEIDLVLGYSTLIYFFGMLFFLYICHRQNVKSLLAVNGGVLFFLVGMVGSSVGEAARLLSFLWVPMAAALASCSSQRLGTAVLSGMFCILNINIFINDYRYLPYTSYPIIYAFQGELPFGLRYQYHHDYHDRHRK